MYADSIQLNLCQSANVIATAEKRPNEDELKLKSSKEEEFWINYVMFESSIDEGEIKQSGEYEAAVRKELKALSENKTRDLTPRLGNVKVISTKWVCQEKVNIEGKWLLKAKLVAR